MIEKEDIILRFECWLETPFHSTEKKYKNLLKCSPYILGSTIRGQLLSNIITRHCAEDKIKSLALLKNETEILEFHSRCELNCPVKEFIWRNKWALFISFGEFKNLKYRSVTRTSISRDSKAASEGNLVNIEQIEDGCDFSFEIISCNDESIVRELKLSIENIGKEFGIGKYKKVGMGRYSIKEVTVKKVKDMIEEKISEFKTYSEKTRLTFKTPFILHHNGSPLDLEQNQFASLFSEMLLKRNKELSEFFNLNFGFQPILIENIRTFIIPDYINRYSLEESAKKNRLIARSGSFFEFSSQNNNDTRPIQLALSSLFGVGEWADVGFGRFTIKAE